MAGPQAATQAIRAVIFDVDGTLVTDAVHRDKHNFILGHVLHRPDLLLTPEEWSQMSGLADEDAYAYITHKAGQRSQHLTNFLPLTTYLSLAQRYVTTHIGQLDIRPGARDLIRAAEALGLLLGVATNAEWTETQQKLSATGLLSHFRFFSCLDGVMAPKPAPDLYCHSLRAAREFLDRRLDPLQILVFEDTEVGATAAATAGCRVVLWPHEKRALSVTHVFRDDQHIVIARSAEDCIQYLHRVSGSSRSR